MFKPGFNPGLVGLIAINLYSVYPIVFGLAFVFVCINKSIRLAVYIYNLTSIIGSDMIF